MNILILLLIGLLGLFGFSSTSSSPSSSSAGVQECTVSAEGGESCSPIEEEGAFLLPDSGDVLTLTVNNGPLPPEYQAGYSVVVDADGTATVTVSPQGSAEDLGDAQTAEATVTVQEIGADGVQATILDMKNCGYFTLPQVSTFDGMDRPVGGGVALIDVQLADGSWSVVEDTLTGDELDTFTSCRTLIEDRFSVESPDL